MKLNTQIFLGITLGVLVGLLFGEHAQILMPIGDVFLRLLKMLIIPLIFTSIIMGVVSLGDVGHLGRLGGRTGLYFVITTMISTSIGCVVATVLKPGLDSGLRVDLSVLGTMSQDPMSWATLFTNIVPSNVVASMSSGQMLPIIFFALLLGAALISIGNKGAQFIGMVDSLNEGVLKLVDWIMRLAPIGVFALMASLVGRTGLDALKPLAFYMGAVLLGLAVHAFAVLPMILIVLGGVSPIKMFKTALPALGMAFSTNSSIATLPLTMDILKKVLNIPQKVVNFVCPIGATVNMDGTALYQAVASIFIAQVYGIELGFTQLLIIVVTATLASIGAAAIPSAGLVTMAIVLNAVGLPIEGIGLILAVDRILDMFRTALNVFTDMVGSVVVARFT